MKNDMAKSFTKTLIALLCFLSFAGQAQDHLGCATIDGKVKWLEEFQQNGLAVVDNGDMLYVPLTIHIVGDNQGQGYIKAEEVRRAFCELQEDFLPSEIQFYWADDINYIDNSNYYEHSWQQGGQMMDQYQVANTINCYFVADPAGACGYSSYNNGIALNNDCVDPGSSTWAHEIGHYLSLPHTFSGWEGEDYSFNEPAPNFVNGAPVERLDGSNCGNAGDGFCDTPADYLSYRWSCDNNGFSIQFLQDPLGEEFKADGTYFMSYSFDGCADKFSQEQTDAMRANLLTEKADYLYSGDPVGPVDFEALSVISPEPGSLVDNYSGIQFTWDPLPNATHYILEVSPFPLMQFILVRYELEDVTSVFSTDLAENQTFYWRLQAYNYWHTCKEYTEIQSFSTGTLNSIQTVESINNWSVVPNPTSAGQDLQVRLELQKADNLQVNLINLAGQSVYSDQWDLAAGVHQNQVATDHLEAGMYFLRIQNSNGTITKKIVVNN